MSAPNSNKNDNREAPSTPAKSVLLTDEQLKQLLAATGTSVEAMTHDSSVIAALLAQDSTPPSPKKRSPNATNVLNDEDDDEDEELEPTIFERMILGREVVEIPNAVEDKLFTDPKLRNDPRRLILMAASSPLQSYLALQHVKNLPHTITRVNNVMHEKREEKSRLSKEHQGTVNAHNSLVTTLEQKRRKLAQLQRQVAELAKDVAVDEEFEIRLLSDIKCEKKVLKNLDEDKEVGQTVLEAAQLLHSWHQNKMTSNLPYANARRPEDLAKIKKAMGIDDYESTDLTTRQHIGLAQAAQMFGFQYSLIMSYPDVIYASNSIEEPALRKQTCGLFQVSIPADALTTTPKKRKAANATMSKKKRKGNVDTTAVLNILRSAAKNSTGKSPKTGGGPFGSDSKPSASG